MVEGEPKLFRNWDPYMKIRQVVASAVIFKNHGWFRWQMGHANCSACFYGIMKPDETGDSNTAKPSRNKAISRTHNYRLLQGNHREQRAEKGGEWLLQLRSLGHENNKEGPDCGQELDMIGQKEIPVGRKKNRKALYRRPGLRRGM